MLICIESEKGKSVKIPEMFKTTEEHFEDFPKIIQNDIINWYVNSI